MRDDLGGAPVEVEKRGIERGMYQHPELYGERPEKGMDYDAQSKRPSPGDLSGRGGASGRETGP